MFQSEAIEFARFLFFSILISTFYERMLAWFSLNGPFSPISKRIFLLDKRFIEMQMALLWLYWKSIKQTAPIINSIIWWCWRMLILHINTCTLHTHSIHTYIYRNVRIHDGTFSHFALSSLNLNLVTSATFKMMHCMHVT